MSVLVAASLVTSSLAASAPTRAAASAAAQAPVLAQSALLTRVGGRVLVRRAGSPVFVTLTGSALVALGASVDASAGHVRVTTATMMPGQAQSAVFYSGRFRLTQARSGVTSLTLDAPLRCTRAHASLAGSARKATGRQARSLWGDGHGEFTTVGRFAAATVLGTRWLTTDTCTGTRVHVATGEVRVTDLVSHRTITLTSGASYTAGFVLTKVIWTDTIVEDSVHDIDLYWQGHPTFPVTATDTALPGCTTATFVCNSGSTVFTKRADPLVWKAGEYCAGETGSGSWDYQLTDASGRKTNLLAKTLHCTKS